MNANEKVINDFIDKHPFAAAQALEQLSHEEVASFLETIALEKITKILGLMNTEKAVKCFNLLPSNTIKKIIKNGNPSLVARLLRATDEPLRVKMLTDVSPSRVRIINRELSFLPNTAASIMETALIVNKEMTVDNVSEIVRQAEQKKEFYLYIVDLEGVFEGIVRLRELFLADKTDTLKNLMITKIPRFLPDKPLKGILKEDAWFEYQEIPILDASGKLLGKLSHRSILKSSSQPIKTSNKEIAATASALGELYRIGLTGLLPDSGK